MRSSDASSSRKVTQSRQVMTTVVDQSNQRGEQIQIMYGDDVIQLPQWWMDHTPHDTMYLFEEDDRNDYGGQNLRQRQGDERDEDDEFVRRMYADEFVRMYVELATRNSAAKNLMLEEVKVGAVGREHIEAAKYLHQKRNELTRLQSEIGNLEKELTMAECKQQNDDEISKLSSNDEDYDNVSLAGLKFVDSPKSTRSK